MATGTTILLNYLACCGFLVLTATTATALYLWGRARERRAARRRERPATDAPAVPPDAPGPDLDPGDADG